MNAPASAITVDMDALVLALSEALGLVGGKIVDHERRVALIALTLAEGLDLLPEDVDDLRQAALLHDAGVSCMRIHSKLTQLDWEGAGDHAREGSRLLADFPRFDRVSEIILHHHDKWPWLSSSQVPLRTALLANLIFLADRIDVQIDWNNEILLNRPIIQSKIANLAGTFFMPEAVNIFQKKSNTEAFWLNLHPRHLPRALTRLVPRGEISLDLDELESLAGIFARIVDAKSRFTHDHSYGVARLCHHLGRKMSLHPATIQKLRVAGLLHDLGKLAIPDEILEKDSSLTSEEFQTIKRHPFETYHILSTLPAIDDIRDWASFHHEKHDSSGYPFHLDAQSLKIEHLIVKMADIVQAMIQDRPYRPGLSQDQVLEGLKTLARQQAALAPLQAIIQKDYDHINEIACSSLTDNCHGPSPDLIP